VSSWTTIKHSVLFVDIAHAPNIVSDNDIDLEAPHPHPLMSVYVSRCGTLTSDISKINTHAKHAAHTACSLSFHYVHKVVIYLRVLMSVCLFLSSWCKTVFVWRKQCIQGHIDSYDSVQVRWAMNYLPCIPEVQSVSLVLLWSWEFPVSLSCLCIIISVLRSQNSSVTEGLTDLWVGWLVFISGRSCEEILSVHHHV